MKITLQTIPHDQQRYPTCGDWIIDGDEITILVSDMGNDDFNFLVALHELVEVKLCQKRGIDQASVDAFDIAFEERRAQGNEDEPGDDPAAPYRREHFFATNVERLMAEQLGVDWDEYEAAVSALD